MMSHKVTRMGMHLQNPVEWVFLNALGSVLVEL